MLYSMYWPGVQDVNLSEAGAYFALCCVSGMGSLAMKPTCDESQWTKSHCYSIPYQEHKLLSSQPLVNTVMSGESNGWSD